MSLEATDIVCAHRWRLVVGECEVDCGEKTRRENDWVPVTMSCPVHPGTATM